MDSRVIKLTPAAHKHGNLNLSSCGKDFFPPDVFGASSQKAGLGVQITLKAEGLPEPVETDIPTDNKTGKPRWLFRERAWVKTFVRTNSLVPGDTVTVHRISNRTYELVSQKRKLSFIDLFCGCGGMSFGFEMAGFHTLLGVDNDPSSLRTFEKNHASAHTFEADLGEVATSAITEKIGKQQVDAIIGGPPCQGVSLSGPRKLDDPRNRLFASFVRITEEINPKAFVVENVPGLFSLFKGKLVEEIVNEFESIGYKVFAGLLSAAAYGVPQTRRRIFLVGLRDRTKEFRFPVGTHSEAGSLLGDSQERYITCEEALSDLPPLNGTLGAEEQNYWSEPKNKYQELMRVGTSKVYNHIGTKHTKRVRQIISLVPEGGNYKDLPDKYKNTRNFHVAWTRYHSKKPAPTIDTGHRHHFHYKYNRVPTVRENARLQSFPDRFIFNGNKGEQNRQAGNAVPPLLAKEVAKEVLKCL